jgi:hypothetical protein
MAKKEPVSRRGKRFRRDAWWGLKGSVANAGQCR